MCDICRQTPCHSACPNAEEEKPVLYCDECKKPIYAGDTYYTDNGWDICEECNRKHKRIAEEK